MFKVGAKIGVGMETGNTGITLFGLTTSSSSSYPF